MTGAPLGIGFAGCGRAAEELHLPSLARLPEAAAVAVCDPDAGALARVAGRFGVPGRYVEIGDLLEDPAVDAVIVCTPPATHADVALAVVAAGKHVLVEKPLALLPADAERMVEVEERARTVTAIGFNQRCHRLVEEARAVVASGVLGPVSTLRTTWTAGSERGHAVPDWRGRRVDGGGILYELGTHHVDLWRYLLGEEIADVTALSRSGVEDDEASVLSGRSTGGTLVSAVLSDRAPDANEVDIVGRDGRLRFSLYRADSMEVTTAADYGPAARARGLARRATALPSMLRAARGGGDFRSSYVRQLERFVAAVAGAGEPAAAWADGLEAARIVQAALEKTEGALTADVPA